jgi:uncharacterized protein YcfJ
MRTALLATLFATTAAVAQADAFIDRARVQSVEPQYDSVQVPRQECTSQWVTESRPASGGTNYGGAIIGGVAGAVIGNQVGKGHGKEAATAVGAVVGAMAGDRMANNNNTGSYETAQREVRNCRTVHDVQNRLTGYRVTYEYRGHVGTMITHEQPGSTVPVRVSVTPADEREAGRR